jgi:hypothetical protein
MARLLFYISWSSVFWQAYGMITIFKHILRVYSSPNFIVYPIMICQCCSQILTFHIKLTQNHKVICLIEFMILPKQTT